jgi:hypothetical protein
MECFETTDFDNNSRLITLSASRCDAMHRSGNRQPKTYVKPEAAIKVFELLMMGGMSPETC